MRSAALLILSLLAAGCLTEVAPTPMTPRASGDTYEAAMAAYLAEGYPRADAVEWEHVKIVEAREVLVGDVPIVWVVALIRSDGKDAHGYFWRSNLTPIHTTGGFPDYRDVSGQNMGYDLVVALRRANATDIVESIVTFSAPEGMPATFERDGDAKRAQDLTAAFLARVAPQVRALDGVESANGSEGASYPWLLLRATPDATRLVAAREEVAAIDVDHVVSVSEWGVTWG